MRVYDTAVEQQLAWKLEQAEATLALVRNLVGALRERARIVESEQARVSYAFAADELEQALAAPPAPEGPHDEA